MDSGGLGFYRDCKADIHFPCRSLIVAMYMLISYCTDCSLATSNMTLALDHIICFECISIPDDISSSRKILKWEGASLEQEKPGHRPAAISREVDSHVPWGSATGRDQVTQVLSAWKLTAVASKGFNQLVLQIRPLIQVGPNDIDYVAATLLWS